MSKTKGKLGAIATFSVLFVLLFVGLGVFTGLAINRRNIFTLSPIQPPKKNTQERIDPDRALDKIFNFEPDYMEESYKITSWLSSASSENVEIPSVYRGWPVTKLGDKVFEKRSKVRTITFSDDCNITEIGSYCFANSKLETIIIPETVTSIGQSAFYECDNLTSVTIPATVTNWDQLFRWSALPSITIPNTVTSLNGTFTSCTKLQSVTFEEGSALTTFDYQTFRGCSALKSITIPAGITELPGYSTGSATYDYDKYGVFMHCSALEEVIFEEGSQLTKIGDYVFYGCKSLQSIDIPNGVETISKWSFRDCAALKTVKFPQALKSIGADAFYNCTSLTEIELPATLQKLYYYSTGSGSHSEYHTSFKNCTSITKITIPVALTNDYGTYKAFEGCSKLQEVILISSAPGVENGTILGQYLPIKEKLTSITIPQGVTALASSDLFQSFNALETIAVEEDSTAYKSSGNCLIEVSTKTLVWGGKNVIIPSDGSVTVIGDNAFKGNISLTSITIPISVTKMGTSVFEGCTGLTSITIPASVASIGGSAFKGCTGLTSVTFEDGSSLTTLPGYIFMNCSALASVNLEKQSSLNTIVQGAFKNCSSLLSITIPKSVRSINSTVVKDRWNNITERYGVFTGCTSLKSVFFEDDSRLESLGDYTFNDCSSLEELYLPVAITNKTWYGNIGSKKLSKITIVSSNSNTGSFYSTTLGSNYPRGSGITEITIPETVTSIGNSALGGCSSLTEIKLPSKLKTINQKAFYECTALKSITIPSTVTSIGTDAFYNCGGLQSITVEEGNTTFHSSGNCLIKTETKTLMVGCTNSTIPTDGSVTIIDQSAFSGRSGLTSISIPDSVTSIGSSAFSGCSDLTSIAIPSSVTSIGSSAFYGCSKLTDITIPTGVTSIGSSAFSGCSGLTQITIPSRVTTISNSAFYYCSGLTSITIPSSVTSIGSYAFEGCSGLTSISIPDSVTSIGWAAFAECSGLTSITIPSSVTSIGTDVFYNCGGLQSITVEEGNTTYHSSGNCLIKTETKELILGCNNSVIPIDGSVTSIESYAFYNCSGLTSITIP